MTEDNVTTTPLSDRPLTEVEAARERMFGGMVKVSFYDGHDKPQKTFMADLRTLLRDAPISRPTANVETGESEGGDYTMALAEKQAFEAFPVLASHIERMAVSGQIGSMIAWDGFLRELNAALTPSPPEAGSNGPHAWLETNLLTGEVRASLSRRADSPTMIRRWHSQPLFLGAAPSPPVQLSEREREAVDDVRGRIATWDGYDAGSVQVGVSVDTLRTILVALTRTTGEV